MRARHTKVSGEMNESSTDTWTAVALSLVQWAHSSRGERCPRNNTFAATQSGLWRNLVGDTMHKHLHTLLSSNAGPLLADRCAE